MNNNKSLLQLTSFLRATVLSAAASTTVFAGEVLEYKVSMAEDGRTYEVWMRAGEAPKPDINLTGQLTLKVPSSAGFKPVEVISAVEGAEWLEASRVDAPAEAPGSDYISFSFIGLQGNSAHNYHWEKDAEKLVFTFENEAGCVDGVSIMPNDDAFNVEGNSANTNPGNQFTNLGWGSVGANNFKGVYGTAISCT